GQTFSSAKMGENLRVYDSINANENNTDRTDLYLIHSQTGYVKNGRFDTLKHVMGATGGAPDYLVLIGDAVGTGATVSHNRSTNINELMNITLPGGPGLTGKKLEGVLNAEGAGTIEDGRSSPSETTIIALVPTHASAYTATILAKVDDLSSGEWLGDVTLTGVPHGFDVSVAGGANA